MPGKLATGRARAPHPPSRPSPLPPATPAGASPVPKQLWTVDASLTAGSPVSDIGELSAAAAGAVRAGGGTVLDTSHVIFPNGAVTLVLILAESHLAIHTWPEENLIAVDLFSCGAIAADRVAGELIAALQLADARVQRMERGVVRR
ncbi:MAG: S-adenosylmethionine decarboxylase [Actinobacteria bacterium]|nr:S-adenosylmethionine decarboxylase [Actinomycetota bacterium]